MPELIATSQQGGDAHNGKTASQAVIFMLQTRYEGKRCVTSDTDENGFYRVTP